jgi:hypothetical protein
MVEEFSNLATQAEFAYGATVSRRTWIEAVIDEEGIR